MEHRVASDLARAPFPDGTSTEIKIILSKGTEALFAAGPTVPTDAASGYGKGCIFLHTDDATNVTGTSTDIFYVNRGSGTSCNFNPVTVAADA